MWDWFDLTLGAWGVWLGKLGMFLGAILIGGLLFCCVLPILRSLVVKATARQMEMLRCQDDEQFNLRSNQNVQYQDWAYAPNWKSQTLTNDGDSSTVPQLRTNKKYKDEPYPGVSASLTSAQGWPSTKCLGWRSTMLFLCDVTCFMFWFFISVKYITVTTTGKCWTNCTLMLITLFYHKWGIRETGSFTPS